MARTVFEMIEIRENIWQVADFDGVCFTLIIGEKEAIVWDTGYGFKDIRAFVESVVKVPYRVILSHGHPDHVGGCLFFDEVWMEEKDRPYYEEYIDEALRAPLVSEAVRLGKITKEEGEWVACQKLPVVRNIEVGTHIDLGGITLEVISMGGHTKGSIGLLLKEEKLLLSGDAINNVLWMFLPESDTLAVCAEMIESVLTLPFDKYLGAHTVRLHSKEQLRGILENIRNLKLDETTKHMELGIYEVYESRRRCEEAESVIVFGKGQVE